MELILQKEHIGFRGDLNSLVLASIDQGVQMRRDKTLMDYGIHGGEELLLV